MSISHPLATPWPTQALAPGIRQASTPRAAVAQNSHVDAVQFSGRARKSEKTEAQKIDDVNRIALKLFSTHKTKEALLNAVAKQFPQLKIYDGSQKNQAWVNDIFQSGHYAFFHFPDSVQYNLDPTNVPDFTKSEGKDAPEIYTKKVLPELFRNKQLAIFASKDADITILQHELYHVIQYMNGLPFGSTPANAETDRKALEFRNSLHSKPFNNRFLDTIWSVGRLAYCLFGELPFAGIRALTRLVKGKPQTPTAGDALRNEMRREMENDTFMLKNAKALGHTMAQTNFHRMHYWMESKLQYLRSYCLG